MPDDARPGVPRRVRRTLRRWGRRGLLACLVPLTVHACRPSGADDTASSSAAPAGAPSRQVVAGTPLKLPPIGIAMLDTNQRWCAAFADSLRPGDQVAIVLVEKAQMPAWRARVVVRRTRPCETAFGQPALSELMAYDLSIVDSLRPDGESTPMATLAVAGTAAWHRGGDGIVRADLDGDARPEEAHVCRAGEGEHFTLWSTDADRGRRRVWHGYFDWGAFVDANCRPDEIE